MKRTREEHSQQQRSQQQAEEHSQQQAKEHSQQQQKSIANGRQDKSRANGRQSNRRTATETRRGTRMNRMQSKAAAIQPASPEPVQMSSRGRAK